MDSGEFRDLLSRSGVGIWGLIETAIKVANSDYGDELRRRRDKIVESLYKSDGRLCGNCKTSSVNNDVVQEDDQYYPQSIKKSDSNTKNISNDDDDNKCMNNNSNNNWNSNEDFTSSKSPLTPESNHPNLSGGEEEEDPYGGLFDDEQSRIIDIKELLEDPNQSEEAVVDLLQTLADMDITYQTLKETDIGRHVNRLRKHPSNEVRRLVKQVVRKWKETVDEWVKVNPLQTTNLIADGDSPQQNKSRNQQNGNHQVPDFGYSPNPQNGSSSADRGYVEHETKPKPSHTAPRREAPSRPASQPPPRPTSASLNRAPRETAVDDERLNSARKRLQENYQEANNAKKQRTIQVMDIHDLPKQKNTFFAKNKGSSHSQGRNHR